MPKKMDWFYIIMPFIFLIFIVWKIIYKGLNKMLKRKNQIIINIYKLNKIIISNKYLLLL